MLCDICLFKLDFSRTLTGAELEQKLVALFRKLVPKLDLALWVKFALLVTFRFHVIVVRHVGFSVYWSFIVHCTCYFRISLKYKSFCRYNVCWTIRFVRHDHAFRYVNPVARDVCKEALKRINWRFLRQTSFHLYSRIVCALISWYQYRETRATALHQQWCVSLRQNDGLCNNYVIVHVISDGSGKLALCVISYCCSVLRYLWRAQLRRLVVSVLERVYNLLEK